MILGLGNDIIEIARVERLLKRFPLGTLQKIYTSREQEICLKKKQSFVHFAGRFAAKEAVVKALGIGFSKGITWTDVEILNDSLGKPIVHLSEKLNILFKNPQILVSISHCRSYATAVAIYTHSLGSV